MRDHFKEQHASEFERRDRIGNVLPLLVGILTIAASGYVYLLSRVELMASAAAYWTVFSTLASCVAFLVAAAYIWAAYHGIYGYQYGYLPSAKAQKDYYDKCLDFYRRFPNREELAWKALEKVLVERYCEAIDLNKETNNSRFDYLYRANAAVLMMLTFLGLAIFFNGYCRLDRFQARLDATPTGYLPHSGGILKVKRIDRGTYDRQRKAGGVQRSGSQPAAPATATAP